MMATLWGDILDRFNKTRNQSQSVETDLETVISSYKSLIQYVLNLRSMFEIYEERAINKLRHITSKNIQKKRKRINNE